MRHRYVLRRIWFADDQGTKFVGTSCVMTISSDPSRIELVEVCNISEERVLLATVA